MTLLAMATCPISGSLVFAHHVGRKMSGGRRGVGSGCRCLVVLASYWRLLIMATALAAASGERQGLPSSGRQQGAGVASAEARSNGTRIHFHTSAHTQPAHKHPTLLRPLTDNSQSSRLHAHTLAHKPRTFWPECKYAIIK